MKLGKAGKAQNINLSTFKESNKTVMIEVAGDLYPEKDLAIARSKGVVLNMSLSDTSFLKQLKTKKGKTK